MNIQQTHDYSRFITVKENRPISKTHLKNIIKSINTNNLLAFNPIIINKYGEVIDGQHRLEAAKRLNIDIYYIVLEEAALKEIILLNAYLKSWGMEDYLHAYVSLGNKHYIQLNEFKKTYDLNLNCCATLLSNNNNDHGLFKQGNFVVANYEMAEKMARAMIEMRDYMEIDLTGGRDFIRAIVAINKRIDLKDILNKLQIREGLQLKRCGDLKQYIRQFEDILNFNQKKEFIRLF